MKKAFYLAGRYHRAHRAQYAASLVCLILFVCALQISILLRAGLLTEMEQSFEEMYGTYTDILYKVDREQLDAYSDQIASSRSGVTVAYTQIATEETDVSVYLGTMDKNTIELKKIRLESGAFPQSAGEIAVEQSTCYALGIDASAIGQSVTLPLVQADGSTMEQTFVLVGILRDYVSEWKRLDSSGNAVSMPPPAVLTWDSGTEPLYVHVLCNGILFPNDLGGVRAENYYHPERNTQLQGQKTTVDLIALPLSILFCIAAFLGIYSLILNALTAMQPYCRLLRLTGASIRLVKRMIFADLAVQYMETVVGGGVCSVLLLFLAEKLMAALGVPFRCVFPPLLFLPPILASFLAFLLSYRILRKRLFPTVPLTNGFVSHKTSKRRINHYGTLGDLWHHATKKQYFSQNCITTLLAAFCVLFSVGGIFFAQFAPRVDHSTAALNNFPEDQDYQLFVTSGGSSPLHFNISLPREMGISQANLDRIRATEGLQVTSAYINWMTSHFLLLYEGEPSPYLHALVEEGRVFEGEGPKMEELKKLLNISSGDQLVEPFLLGMDVLSVREQYDKLTEGVFQEETFVSGEEILAPDSVCHVGEEYTLITPVLLEGSPKKDQSDQITFDIRTVRVGATYPSEQTSDPVILSAEFIFSIDPSARYESIGILNTRKDRPETEQQAQALLMDIASRSDNVSFRNFLEERSVYEASVRSKTLGILASLAVFLVMLLLSFTLATYVRVKTNFHSYTLMRTMGANRKTISQLLLSENLFSIFRGGLLGYLISLAVIVWLCREFDYLPFWDILWNASLPTFLGTFGIMMIFNALAIRRPVKELLQKSVVDSILKSL